MRGWRALRAAACPSASRAGGCARSSAGLATLLRRGRVAARRLRRPAAAGAHGAAPAADRWSRRRCCCSARPRCRCCAGCRRPWRRTALGPFLAWPALRRVGDAARASGRRAGRARRWRRGSGTCPPLYELALRSPGVARASSTPRFLAAGLLFWWPVVQPWPSRAAWPRWTMRALPAARRRPEHAASPRSSRSRTACSIRATPRCRASAASPRSTTRCAAGALMWVPASLALPGAGCGDHACACCRRAAAPVAPRGAGALAARARTRFDLLARCRCSVACCASPAIAPGGAGGRAARAVAAVVADGLLGPPMSPMNLAGVLPWTYWRGLTVVALLAAGNFFCFACPFMLPRALARRLAAPTRRLAARRCARSGWRLVLLVLVFWADEAFGLWDDPRATAWLILGYFVAALLVDSRSSAARASASTSARSASSSSSARSCRRSRSRVRDPAVCATLHDARLHPRQRDAARLRARALPARARPATSTARSASTACTPARTTTSGCSSRRPADTLSCDGRRSSLGRLSQRLDVAALALVLVLARSRSRPRWCAPCRPRCSLALLGGAAAGRRGPGGGTDGRCASESAASSLALVPLGFAMWTAHFLFHLVRGWSGMVLASERALADVGMAAAPHWSAGPSALGPGRLLGLELLLLDAGLLLTLWVGWRIARDAAPRCAARWRWSRPARAWRRRCGPPACGSSVSRWRCVA